MSEMPKSVVIDLVDSLTSYHCPYQGSVHPRGKYGPRRRRQPSGRGPAAQNRRFGLCDLLRPRAHLAI